MLKQPPPLPPSSQPRHKPKLVQTTQQVQQKVLVHEEDFPDPTPPAPGAGEGGQGREFGPGYGPPLPPPSLKYQVALGKLV